MPNGSDTETSRIFYVLILVGAFYMLISPILYGANAADLMRKYDPIIANHAREQNVPPELVHSIIRAESNYDRMAISPKGAMGLMQLMPATAKEYGVKNVFDPADNIKGGIKYLKDLIALFEGKTSLVLAAYNAGQEAVKKFNGIPPYPETKNYIQTVMSRYSSPTIKQKTIIYRFYDSSGRLVLTNDKNYYLANRGSEGN